jgi:hypothetical protein
MMVSAGSTSCPAYGAFEHGTITRSAPGLSENAERSMPRSRLRLAAVFAGLLAALVAIVTVAIALTQSQHGEAEDMAIPSISLDAPARPNELLSLSAAGMAQPRHQTFLLSCSALHMPLAYDCSCVAPYLPLIYPVRVYLSFTYKLHARRERNPGV